MSENKELWDEVDAAIEFNQEFGAPADGDELATIYEIERHDGVRVDVEFAKSDVFEDSATKPDSHSGKLRTQIQNQNKKIGEHLEDTKKRIRSFLNNRDHALGLGEQALELLQKIVPNSRSTSRLEINKSETDIKAVLVTIYDEITNLEWLMERIGAKDVLRDDKIELINNILRIYLGKMYAITAILLHALNIILSIKNPEFKKLIGPPEDLDMVIDQFIRDLLWIKQHIGNYDLVLRTCLTELKPKATSISQYTARIEAKALDGKTIDPKINFGVPVYPTVIIKLVREALKSDFGIT